MRQANPKAEQLHIRASDLQKKKLLQAAKLRHMNVSQFVLQTSLEVAEAILAEQSRIALSVDDFRQFCKLLDQDPVDLPKLEHQFKKGSVFT